MTPNPPPSADLSRTHVQLYGWWWPRIMAVHASSAGIAEVQEAQIELKVLGNYTALLDHGAQLLPWVDHFKRLVTLIWDRPDSTRRFVWNPNAVRILDELHRLSSGNDKMYMAVAGHASSSKSEFFAMYAILAFLIGATHPAQKRKKVINASPEHVKVFVTSTTLEESRARIWGTIEKYWNDACKFFGGEEALDAKLVSSLGKIVRTTKDRTGKVVANQLAGVALIPGGKGHDGDVDTKIGFKNRRVVFIADELPLLTHKLYKSATGNLASNPELQFFGLGNPTSPFDPFGVFMEPKDGWKSVDDTYEGWETKDGYCIRFDGEKSANVLAGREVFPGLLTLDSLMEFRERYGAGYAKNAEYYRMVRGFLAPDGDSQAVYTDAEILGSDSMSKITTWSGTMQPELNAFLDPAFSHEGDEACMAVCKVGTFYNPLHQQEVKAIELISIENLLLKVNAADKKRDRNTQLVDLFHEKCEKLGIKVENRGVDATGAGDPFATLMAIKMGQGFQRVSFGGAASDKQVSPTDRRPGNERFANRVSELWGVGKELMKGGQIRGLDADTCNQMRARLFKGGVKEKLEVEPKKNMKQRTNGRSPDRADAFFGCVEIARRRHSLSSASKSAAKPHVKKPSSGNAEWDAMNAAFTKRKPVMGDLATPGLSSGGDAWGN